MAKYAYTGLTLNGRFSDDGEYFMLDTDINGQSLRVLTLYVGDQRETFTAAAQAPPSKPTEPTAPTEPSSTPPEPDAPTEPDAPQ